MEILVYGKDLYRKGILENHTSLIWTRKYYEPGNFELQCPLTNTNIKLLAKGCIITKKDSLESGVIENISISGSQTSNLMVVKGRFLSSYLDRRLIKSTFSFSGQTQKAMTDLIDIVSPIPLLRVKTLKSFDDQVTFQATMKNLLTIETKLAKTSGIGFRIVPDFVNKVLYFETYKGVNRSENQSLNNKVIFSEEYRNIDKATYEWNDQLLKTCAIVGGEGEGSLRKYITVGGGEGLDLREIFVDAKDIQSEGLTQTEYENMLIQRGLDNLAKNVISETFESSVVSNGNFKYKIDYDLGDIVSIKKESWGLTLNQRITEIQEIYENGGVTIIPTFGDALPDTIDWSD